MSASPGAAEHYDVAIVGASVAGCTAARFYAQRGARVALIERKPSLDAYKTTCTHFIQSSATPTVERLGLAPLLDERGAVHNGIDLWTASSGWVQTAENEHGAYGFNITRRKLDPLLRRLAAETPGVELISGWSAVGLLGDSRPTGVQIEDRTHARRQIHAKLVVGADGRDSKVARWARVPGRVKPHGRFFYWGYWRGVQPVTSRSKMWLIDPDAAYTFPNEDGLTVVLVGPHRDRLPEFQADLHGAYRRMLGSLPGGPDLREATLEGKLLGKLELPNVYRPAARNGVAFVGDAACAGDPLWGIGCGWAMQSAEWLVEQTANALNEPTASLDAALERYRKLHRKRLFGHYSMISDIASGRPLNPIERRIYRAATRDEAVREMVIRVGSRELPPSRMFSPRMLARILRFGSAAQPA